MGKKSFIAILACAAPVLFSCSSPAHGGKEIGSYARELVEDSTNTAYQIIAASRERNVSGNIAIIGEPEQTLAITEFLKHNDSFDNVNGSKKSDGLPDFAGETICPIIDEYNTPYSAAVSTGNGSKISEITVKNFIAALDSACYLNAYDTEKIVHKSIAKLVILSSLYSSVYGYSDIDTLCSMASSKVKVVSPVHTILKDAWKGVESNLCVAVWTTRDIQESRVYETVFDRLKKARSDNAASISVIVPADSLTSTSDRFLDFMKQYSSQQTPRRLNAILIDDISVDLGDLNEALASVMSVDQDSYLTYLNYLAKNFRIIEMKETVASDCFHIMRENNLFTHKIAYPKVKLYLTAASQRDSSYVTVELKDKNMSDSLRSLMILHAPKIFSDYVR